MEGGGGNDSIGGLVGWQNGAAAAIENSYAIGNVDGESGNDNVGGLVGLFQNGNITNSYTTGNVEGGAGTNDTGGLLGELGASAAINGVNYFVDVAGTAGIGNGTCTSTAVCQQAMNLQEIFDALFRTASTTAPLGMGWDDTMEWTNPGTAHPCVPDIDFGPGNGCSP